MPQICTRIPPANRALTLFVNRAWVICIARILDQQASLRRKKASVARAARRQHAVHHVDPEAHVIGEAVPVSRRPSDSAACPRAAATPPLPRSRTLFRAARRRQARRSRSRENREPPARPHFRGAALDAFRLARSRKAPGAQDRHAPRNNRASAAPNRASARPHRVRAIPSEGASMHSSSTMMMSAPNAISISSAFSGERKCSEPSRCERNVTPSFVTLRSSLKLKT